MIKRYPNKLKRITNCSGDIVLKKSLKVSTKLRNVSEKSDLIILGSVVVLKSFNSLVCCLVLLAAFWYSSW